MDSHFINKKKVLKTKDKILLEAAILFAQRGYTAVSMKDIAERVKIKSASIYAHFSSKEEIFNIIVNNIKNIYIEFQIRNDIEVKKAENFRQVIEYMFSELKNIYDIYIYYGISLITIEQFRNELARDALNNVFIKKGIERSKAKFDECIEKKWVKSFDTQTLATILMNNIFVGTLMRTHEDMKHETAYDVDQMFSSLQNFILGSVEIIE